ncbi:MAG: hypothetical protein M3O61_17390, partial [Gemmatimonadota bacterium]|nr:hypothetical protein [Gemmatimonadota bacterium]
MNAANNGRRAHPASMNEGSKRFGGLSGLSRTGVSPVPGTKLVFLSVFNNKNTRHAELRFACMGASSETIRIIRRIPSIPLSWMPE